MSLRAHVGVYKKSASKRHGILNVKKNLDNNFRYNILQTENSVLINYNTLNFYSEKRGCWYSTFETLVSDSYDRPKQIFKRQERFRMS